ncbi:hypothetical protein AGMMS49545_01690 [Betaproteobacteria bacterium]|nr:hypothetical protein AGMMS49545_01690 [Betaproteobacteria bacterium]GHU43745.1 hypothetical protein AGMMS50289_10700 [Betaproteobacteria bacterium]
MNFFEAQARARRNSFWLVVWLFATHPPIAERIARIQRDFPLSAFANNNATAGTSGFDAELPIVSFRSPPPD